MPAIDRINRNGMNSRRVLLGPSRLGPPTPQGTNRSVARSGFITGRHDQYEITTTGAGVSDVAYTVIVRPFIAQGMVATATSIGKIAMVKQAGGIALPTAGVTCLDSRPHRHSRATTTMGPFVVNAADRLWVIVEERSVSTVKYQLELVADFITINTQPANSSVTAPAAANFTVAATTNDGGALSYQWQISTDGGLNFSNVSNGGVYSGATTATLAISNSTGLNTRRYRALVTSNATAPVATSTSALLTVA